MLKGKSKSIIVGVVAASLTTAGPAIAIAHTGNVSHTNPKSDNNLFDYGTDLQLSGYVASLAYWHS